MKRIIYYFSGTGNSLNAARIIAGELGGAELISMKNDPAQVPALGAEIVGIVCPTYEWDVPHGVRDFLEKLEIDPAANFFMVSTCVFIHGRSFETVAGILQKKGAQLSYGKALYCVASECIAYEPFPFPKLMVPYSNRKAHQIGQELASGKHRGYPRMAHLGRALFPKLMTPFLNVQVEFDKGFYVSDACIGCGLCSRVCPRHNITLMGGKPVWNHRCDGCNACVVYCPHKAVQWEKPEAYRLLKSPIAKKLKLPDHRTRYHHPDVSARDMISERETIK